MKKCGNGKIEKVFSMYPITIPAIVVCILLCFVLFFYNIYVAVVGLVISIILLVVGFVKNTVSFKRLEGAVSSLDKKLSVDSEYGELKNFPLPVLLFDGMDNIVWYNSEFRNEFISDYAYDGIDVKRFTSGQGANDVCENKFIDCEFNNKKYTAFSGKTQYKNETVYILYFVENTELKEDRKSVV